MTSRVVWLYIALALGFASLYWLLIVLAQHGMLPFAMEHFDFSLDHNSVPGVFLALVLRDFGPAVAAVIALACIEGHAGLSSLGRSLLRWRLPVWLYALALIGPLVVSAVVIAATAPFGIIKMPTEAIHPLRLLLFFPLMLVFDGPLGEEIGWRGLLLPRLLKTMTALKASLLVGCVWFAWHIPLYLSDGRHLHPVSYFIGTVSLSIVSTWIYLKSGRSTAMAIFFHNTTNYALFLIIKCFRIDTDGLATVQLVYDVVMVAVAIAAAVSLHRGFRGDDAEEHRRVYRT